MGETKQPEVKSTPPPTTATPPTFTFNEVALKKHLEAVIEKLNSFVGKRNFNPFMWIKDNMKPLVDRLEAGEKSPALSDAIMALPLDVYPVVDPTKVHVENEPVAHTKPLLSPEGLKLK